MPSACRPIRTVPIIMIGPGTGVAPFRAFLHERMATKAPGRNWLFFGHQKRDFDFFYEDEFNGMKAAGVLTRLSLAWSRDGEEKFYVQDRMLQVGRELWSWIADGAHIYVCGDAQRMAKDVERALIDIVAAHGARSTNEAVAFRRRAEEVRPLPDGRVLTHARAAPAAARRPHHLPLLRGRLRRAGAAGRPAAARSPPAIPIIRRTSAGCAPRASRWRRRSASTAACSIRCCGAPTAAYARVDWDTALVHRRRRLPPRRSSATGRTRSRSISPASF